MNKHISLFFERGFTQRRVFDLCDGLTTVGSNENCEITVPDIYVSRRHLELKLSNGAALARDLNSKNGSTINGVRLSHSWRKAGYGDQITLAGERVSIRLVNGHETVSLSDNSPHQFDHASLTLDYDSRTALLKGMPVAARLSETQFNIFSYLWEHPGTTVRADRLKAQGWSGDITVGISDSALRTQMSRIRNWMARCELTEINITDVRGVGYRLERTYPIDKDLRQMAPVLNAQPTVASV